jgi:hypothetical protein
MLRRTALTALGLGLILSAWVVGQPRMAGPDEADHYLKSVASASGQWYGDKPTGVPNTYNDRTARVFSVPESQRVATGLPCFAFHPAIPASCQRESSGQTTSASRTGSYAPFVYVVFGVPARAAGGAHAGLFAARAGNALLALVLLFGALWCAPNAAARLAVLLAAAPMTIFLSSIVNPNGPEVTGAIAFAAATFALLRDQDRPALWAWWTFGGVVLCLSKTFGPGWAVLVLAAAAVLGGRAGVARVWAGARRRLWAPLVVAVCASAQGAWTVLRMPSPGVSLADIRHQLRPALQGLPAYLWRGSIGVFGWLDVRLPMVFHIAVGIAVVVGTVLVLRATTPRHRFVVAAWVVLTTAISVAVTAATQLALGFGGGQARFTFALVAVLPLLIAAGVCSWDVSPKSRVAVLGAFAVLQLVAWWWDARRYAVGVKGPHLFLRHPTWSPSGGWGFPLAALVVGLAIVLVSEGRALPVRAEAISE